jgi:hypothetical protein
MHNMVWECPGHGTQNLDTRACEANMCQPNSTPLDAVGALH